MTEETEPSRETASKQATNWLILLQEEPDDPEILQRFDAWLAESPAHEAAWAATQHAADVIGATPPAYADRWQPYVARGDGREAAARAAASTQTPGPDYAARPRRRRLLQAASLALAACLAILFFPPLTLHLQADYSTGTGEMQTVRLSDGSTLILAPDSAIAVDFSARQRHVNLLAGEAFFDVTSDRERPFRVSAREVRATVLGTMFNVLREDEGATVALREGRVRVDHDTASPPVSETLEAGDYVRVSWTGDVFRGNRPPDQVAAWLRGQLIAHDQPMSAVVDRLRRYYDGAIIVADGSLDDRSVTGVYNLSDPVEALRGIAHAHGATVLQLTPWVLLISGRS